MIASSYFFQKTILNFVESQFLPELANMSAIIWMWNTLYNFFGDPIEEFSDNGVRNSLKFSQIIKQIFKF